MFSQRKYTWLHYKEHNNNWFDFSDADAVMIEPIMTINERSVVDIKELTKLNDKENRAFRDQDFMYCWYRCSFNFKSLEFENRWDAKQKQNIYHRIRIKVFKNKIIQRI